METVVRKMIINNRDVTSNQGKQISRKITIFDQLKTEYRINDRKKQI